MASFAGYLPRPSGLSPVEQVDMIWAMGVASLVSNNYQIIVPVSVTNTLGAWGINELVSRLSHFLDGAPTTAYNDAHTQTVHICRASDHDAPTPSGSPFANPHQPSASPAATESSTKALVSTQVPASAKKGKVPRPPNAFILYRKHHHPILKEKNPDMHNNQISIILGRKWNEESEDVKNEYRARAEMIKKKHAVDNPGYQYAPRKPSEKKRRMTARKLAHLRATNSEEPPEYSMSVAPSPDPAEPAGVVRANSLDDLFHPTEDSEQVSVDLPVPRRLLQQQLDDYQRSIQQDHLLSFDDELQQNHLVTKTAPSAQNDQDFMSSLIDWDGIRRDAALVFGATLEETQDLAAVENGEPQNDFLAGMTDEEFNDELDRLTRMI